MPRYISPFSRFLSIYSSLQTSRPHPNPHSYSKLTLRHSFSNNGPPSLIFYPCIYYPSSTYHPKASSLHLFFTLILSFPCEYNQFFSACSVPHFLLSPTLISSYHPSCTNPPSSPIFTSTLIHVDSCHLNYLFFLLSPFSTPPSPSVPSSLESRARQ